MRDSLTQTYTRGTDSHIDQLFIDHPDVLQVEVDYADNEVIDITVYFIDAPDEPFPLTSLKSDSKLRKCLEVLLCG